MANLAWYSTKSGWMLQQPAGLIAFESLRPCDKHEPEADATCSRCDDGPFVEAGYRVEPTADGYDIFRGDELVAEWSYQGDTPGGALRRASDRVAYEEAA